MKRTSLGSIAVLVGLTLTCLTPAAAQAQAPALVVDLSASTGPVTTGATGFLYGLADEGVPSDNMLVPLRPVVAAQKAPDGLQHPNGDALDVAPQFRRTGGRDIQIYMQDVLTSFPYENPGIQAYLGLVDTMTRKIVADPNRAAYVYVPFNEPNDIWYRGNLAGLQNDWRLVYQRIRSIDPTARIAGPNFSGYRDAEYRSFLAYTRDNNVLPDVTTWHELGNDFFTDWYSHISTYRASERALGISPRPVSINEYGRFSGDLGVPGNLVQFMTRFENSKVTGCLAYWTDSGSLNDLVADTETNRATGAWWLYKWYGELTGNTVAVTPPTRDGALQGLATYDGAKRQGRVVFGGAQNVNSTYSTSIAVRGVPAALGSSVHATVWGVDTTGIGASSGPYVVTEGDFTVSGGQASVPLANLRGSSAYQVILTPNTDLSPASPTRYEAEYAQLSGAARVTYGTNTGYSGTYFAEGYGATANAGTTFVVTAPTDGYYTVGLRYAAGPAANTPADRVTRLTVNGTAVQDLALPGTGNWNTWRTATTRLYLQGGINRLGVNAFTSDDRDAINPDYLELTATTGPVATYEAEAATRGGTAAIRSNTNASGGQFVGDIGLGAANTLTFANVSVPTAGRYRMVVRYANAEVGSGGGGYNNNTVNRYADISVNGGAGVRKYFRYTGSFATYRTAVVEVTLAAGTNRITFANSAAYAPDIDRIQVAAPLG